MKKAKKTVNYAKKSDLEKVSAIVCKIKSELKEIVKDLKASCKATKCPVSKKKGKKKLKLVKNAA